MKSFIFFPSLALLLLASLEAAGSAEPAAPASQKDARLLSLFAIVNFENDDCVAVDGGTATGNLGKCYTSTECTSKGGVARGNCAAGFGTCCVVTIAACGGTVDKNSTYIANLGFTTTSTTGVTTAETCTYTVNYCNDQICQLRLDFQTFDLKVGADGLVTGADRMTVTGPTGKNPPVITGLNTGYHMYVETGTSATATTIAVQVTAGTAARWNIRVDQIECSNLAKAPTGCTQYFTATAGTITSYNFQTGSPNELTSQNLAICIRAGPSNCRIQYTATSATSFIVGAATAGAETTTCDEAAVVIPRAIVSDPAVTKWGGFVCHETFSSTDGTTTDGAIVQEAPFLISYRSDSDATASLTGFSLDYVQQGCS